MSDTSEIPGGDGVNDVVLIPIKGAHFGVRN